MSERLTPDALNHIAHLARLNLTPEEELTLAHQASGILDYIDMLQDLDTAAIEPTFQVQPRVNVWREDQVQPSLSLEQVLLNAPVREGDYFKMPKIL
jgi:aspartyl-tRNA(Asn)/glutamyl-tRNA(Gln) amidotransferase subunit C